MRLPFIIRKFLAIFVSIAFLFGGVLMVYRGLLPSSKLKSVRSKIHNLNIDVFSGNRGKLTYAIAFDVNAWNDRHGISLGSDISSKDEKIYLSLDSVTLYTITVDPTVGNISEGFTLDVRSILVNDKKIFEEDIVTSIISGVFLFLLGLVIFYFIFLRRRYNPAL